MDTAIIEGYTSFEVSKHDRYVVRTPVSFVGVFGSCSTAEYIGNIEWDHSISPFRPKGIGVRRERAYSWKTAVASWVLPVPLYFLIGSNEYACQFKEVMGASKFVYPRIYVSHSPVWIYFQGIPRINCRDSVHFILSLLRRVQRSHRQTYWLSILADLRSWSRFLILDSTWSHMPFVVRQRPLRHHWPRN